MEATEQTTKEATEQTPLVDRPQGRLRPSVLSRWQTAARAARSLPKTETYQSYRAYWYSVVRPHAHTVKAQLFRYVLISLIVASVIVFVIDSDPYIHRRYRTAFSAFEGVTSCVFLAEWCLRVWTIPESRKFREKGAYVARMSFILTVGSAIDLLAVLPWFIERIAICLCYVSVHSCNVELPNFSFLRIFRLFRLFRAAPILSAFEVVARVLYYNAEILLVALLICVVMILITSTLLFYLAPREATSADFSSIPATMYLSVMMLTGQGQPEGRLPWYTKVMVVFTSIFSVAQFAIPASMLTWGFEQEAQRRVRKNHEERRKMQDRVRRGLPAFSDSSVSSDPESSDSSWEEYEKIAAAESESESEADEEKGGKELRRAATAPPQPLGTEDVPSAKKPAAVPEDMQPGQQLLVQIASQLAGIQREVERIGERNMALEERNKALEAETARLRG